ncbi:MAG: ribonuclease HII [Chloroflexota bacterium]|nr:ribonuclease HII [Chloroflexota bacterium]
MLAQQGHRLVAGVDEAGRGPLAGPAVAAAVVLPTDLQASWLEMVDDSKRLTPKTRESLFTLIAQNALATGIGYAQAEEIDRLGIARAVRMAMCAAVRDLSIAPDFLLIDFVRLEELPIPQRSLTKGDRLSLSIACASIMAKVTRDRLMTSLDSVYPQYGFSRHKGYGTAEHIECLRRFGPCPAHRKSFTPVKDCVC